MSKHLFTTEKKLIQLINDYFKTSENADSAIPESLPEDRSAAGKAKRKIHEKTGLPTITGLALYLGFNSLKEFEDYETNGLFSDALKWGQLRIEAAYEKKLHQHQPHAGVIFALKSMGWGEKSDNRSNDHNEIIKVVKIQIIDSDTKLPSDEQNVVL